MQPGSRRPSLTAARTGAVWPLRAPCQAGSQVAEQLECVIWFFTTLIDNPWGLPNSVSFSENAGNGKEEGNAKAVADVFGSSGSAQHRPG